MEERLKKQEYTDAQKQYLEGLRERARAIADESVSAATRKKIPKSSAPLEPALSPAEFRPFQLAAVFDVSPNTKIFRFKMNSEFQALGLNVASCLVTRAVIGGASPSPCLHVLLRLAGVCRQDHCSPVHADLVGDHPWLLRPHR